MSMDYAKKEQAFLDALKQDTGHDLGEWLILIGAEDLEERNDIIDWLRQQGFTFSRASWLERIYHNGGQPIYADEQHRKQSKPRLPKSASTASDVPKPDAKSDALPPVDGTQSNPTAAPTPERSQSAKMRPNLRVVASQPAPQDRERQHTARTPDSGQTTSDLETTLARAKGLRPLAQHLVKALTDAIPRLRITPLKTALLLSRDEASFAIITIGGKDLRLGLDLHPDLPKSPFQAPQFAPSHTRISENITHMIILDDVRQIDADVIAQAKTAADRV
ncbi:MAG: hypothetical protein K0U34_05285 [Alphaproteobacteria bacterium]|nr:hypothetical protein [Alphaproteobacteria bacterium]